MNRSSITCTLPAPTPNEGLPEEYADFTIGIPPVATVTSHIAIRACVLVIEGSRTTCTIPSGTPRGLSTSLIISTASEEQCFAFGCGAIMMAFCVFRANIIFDIGVTIGLVIGVMPATTPIGLAISIRFVLLSMLSMPIDFLSFRSYHTPFDLLRFLATLSSYTPIPVSSTASLARRSALSNTSFAVILQASSTSAWSNVWQ